MRLTEEQVAPIRRIVEGEARGAAAEVCSYT